MLLCCKSWEILYNLIGYCEANEGVTQAPNEVVTQPSNASSEFVILEMESRSEIGRVSIKLFDGCYQLKQVYLCVCGLQIATITIMGIRLTKILL